MLQTPLYVMELLRYIIVEHSCRLFPQTQSPEFSKSGSVHHHYQSRPWNPYDTFFLLAPPTGQMWIQSFTSRFLRLSSQLEDLQRCRRPQVGPKKKKNQAANESSARHSSSHLILQLCHTSPCFTQWMSMNHVSAKFESLLGKVKVSWRITSCILDLIWC